MHLELESAANFLLNLLRLHSHIVVDKLELFRESLLRILHGHYHQHWFPDKPFKGSGYRCLRINHKLDPIIAKAGVTCGMDEGVLKSLLPNELTLWIDPSEVSYRIGENGSICVLYDAKSNEPLKSEATREGITPLSPKKRATTNMIPAPISPTPNHPSPTPYIDSKQLTTKFCSNYMYTQQQMMYLIAL
ncbi:protein BTG2-like [Brevipalpus obovatus]|uniref:protein BTG2-like n=1 Tax=Brevipalpus obovatus TaxID=246614 RepID=UPI003D9E5F23